MRSLQIHILSTFLLCILTACSFNATESPPPEYPVQIPYLDKLFEDQANLLSTDGEVRIRLIDAGMLHLPTGKIVATDPFTLPDREPFWHQVPKGHYPVVLSVARYPNLSYEAFAAARINFSEKESVEWHLATIPGEDPSTLNDDEFFGFPVDSGTAAFMSPEGAQAFARHVVTLFGIVNLKYIKQVSEEMEKNSSMTPWANLNLNTELGLNAILFTSGFGDGVYASYWGYDEDGNVACLVTDFGLVSEDANIP